MTQSLWFTAIGIGLYFVADALLEYLENARGSRFEHRPMVFFAIIFALAAATFQVLRLISD